MADAPGACRLDKFLWFARIVKTRALAQAMAEGGRLRLDGRVVDKAHAPVRVGDVLGFARTARSACCGSRRCPSAAARRAEARALYSELTSEAGRA